MNLSNLDWVIIFSFFALFLFIGIFVSKKAGTNSKEFFLSGRNMPWWLIGISMVATTFSADTPNLVTNIVRQDGVAGNWTWWAFLITGMVTVFVYAKLWRRSGVMTDLEFYELRYSGKPARFLRAFRAIYLGAVFNVFIMATVILAAVKIGSILFNLDPVTIIVIASLITVIYSSLGGLRGVILTDFLQFIIAMVGSIGAALYIMNLPEIGGLEALLSHENVAGKLDLVPDLHDPSVYVPLLLIPIAVQWWSAWYPGAEPGGGGYIAQRMLSAKNEKHAVLATLLFNVAHYALRPWPWIIIALGSLVIYPNLDSIQASFPQLNENLMGDDLGYPAMLLSLPKGLIGLVLASLIAAFMSTISTHLNWGASYVVHDFYQRFIKPDASEKELVNMGRLSTLVLMILAGLLALVLESARDAFNLILQIGAGTGSIFIMRWFWWRVNAYSELTGMVTSFLVALYFTLTKDTVSAGIPGHIQLVVAVGVTTFSWVLVTLLTQPSSKEQLLRFYTLIKPYGAGWNGFKSLVKKEDNIEIEAGVGKFSFDLLALFLGIAIVYSALFATGLFIYGSSMLALGLSGVTVVASIFLIKIWKRLSF